LKVGYFNHELYLKGALPVHSRFVDLPFEMYENSEYPMLVASSKRHPIWVELFEVDADKLQELGDLEAPYDYWRETLHLEELSLEVEIYVHASPPPPSFTLVATGEWRPPSLKLRRGKRFAKVSARLGGQATE